MSDHSLPIPTLIDTICEQLYHPGWGLFTQAIPRPLCHALRQQLLDDWQAGAFHAATIGKQGDHRQSIRGDHICWLSDQPTTPPLIAWQQFTEDLRQALNQRLWLNLQQMESMFARYPAGAHYARHLDRFHDDDSRTVTLILYLNPAWQASDGGELQLYLPDRRLSIAPEEGSLVAFLSGDYEHEVLAAQRERLSLTGWYRRRSAAIV
jgi:SM-20-related protein